LVEVVVEEEEVFACDGFEGEGEGVGAGVGVAVFVGVAGDGGGGIEGVVPFPGVGVVALGGGEVAVVEGVAWKVDVVDVVEDEALGFGIEGQVDGESAEGGELVAGGEFVAGGELVFSDEGVVDVDAVADAAVVVVFDVVNGKGDVRKRFRLRDSDVEVGDFFFLEDGTEDFDGPAIVGD